MAGEREYLNVSLTPSDPIQADSARLDPNTATNKPANFELARLNSGRLFLNTETSGGSISCQGSTSDTGSTAAPSDTSVSGAPNSMSAGNRTGNNSANSPLPGQPGNPQTGPIRR